MAKAAFQAFVNWKVPDAVKTLLVVGGISGIATYQVFSSGKKKDGHQLLSSEKPQAMRNEVQERDLETERIKLLRTELKKEAASQRAKLAAAGQLKADAPVA